MRRADKSSLDSIIVRVRDCCGTYIASGGGQRTSCTAGPHLAVAAHCEKIFKGRKVRIAAMSEDNTWRATAEPEAAR